VTLEGGTLEAFEAIGEVGDDDECTEDDEVTAGPGNAGDSGTIEAGLFSEIAEVGDIESTRSLSVGDAGVVGEIVPIEAPVFAMGVVGASVSSISID
jgi:hypothetical protein